MSKPLIFAVDDDPQVLAAVSHDLRRQYGGDYGILRAASGAEAIDAVAEVVARGQVVALFVVDQRMPQMSGTEFLVQAASHYPDAKKILLTAYADTDAAIAAINEVGLDHYLMKPWDPPEDRLYPIVDELLDDWRASVPAPYDGIKVVGARWSPDSSETKDFLSRNQLPYRFLDIESNPEAQTIAEAGGQQPQLPLVVLPDGTRLERPDHRDLARVVGLQTEASTNHYDLVVVGAGPAGLGAAVYGASEGLRTAVIERHATGGQAGQSSRIETTFTGLAAPVVPVPWGRQLRSSPRATWGTCARLSTAWDESSSGFRCRSSTTAVVKRRRPPRRPRRAGKAPDSGRSQRINCRLKSLPSSWRTTDPTSVRTPLRTNPRTQHDS